VLGHGQADTTNKGQTHIKSDADSVLQLGTVSRPAKQQELRPVSDPPKFITDAQRADTINAAGPDDWSLSDCSRARLAYEAA